MSLILLLGAALLAKAAPPAPPPKIAAPCARALLGRKVEAPAGDADLAAFLAAADSNNLDRYHLYLDGHPDGECAGAVRQLIADRTARLVDFAQHPTTGAAPAQRQSAFEMTVEPEDEPPADFTGGTTVAAWQVAEDGAVEDCRIVHSSGAPALDAAACRAITHRARYLPARGADGKPVRGTDQGSFPWRAAPAGDTAPN